jgi:glycosyltransferase involved in cell wall biosynthesis
MGKNVKRISWIHEQNIYMPYHLIAKCYKNFDHIFGCSKDCCDNFIDVFPKTKDYVSVYYNYLDVDEIKKKSTEKIDDICLRKDNVFKIVSVGRVSEQKAFARVVDCAKILKDSGYQFYWTVIGDGEQLHELRKKVDYLMLNEYVNFVGYCTNPYPYIKQADLYVQTSIAEGFCTTISEAIILGKAVVTTDVSGAREQLEGNKGGIITGQSVDGIAIAVKELIDDRKKLMNMAEDNVNKNMDFTREIEKLYKCLE